MNDPIRKQLPNYSLPSEAWDNLSALVGKQIHSIKTGIWHDSLDVLYQKLGLPASSKLWSVAHGGPIFISIGGEQTYVFQSDDFTRSLAVRVVPFSVESATFIHDFYDEDAYFPDYLRMKSIVDLTDSCLQFTQQCVQAIKILKLPDNYFGIPTKGISVNEVAVVFSFENAGDLIIAFRMGAVHGNGHNLLSWDLVKSDFPKDELQCIHECSEGR